MDNDHALLLCKVRIEEGKKVLADKELLNLWETDLLYVWLRARDRLKQAQSDEKQAMERRVKAEEEEKSAKESLSMLGKMRHLRGYNDIEERLDKLNEVLKSLEAKKGAE